MWEKNEAKMIAITFFCGTFIGHSRDVKNTNTTKRILDHHSGIQKKSPFALWVCAETYSSSAFLGRSRRTPPQSSHRRHKKKADDFLACVVVKPSRLSFRREKRVDKRVPYVFWESRMSHSKTCWPFFFHSCLGF